MLKLHFTEARCAPRAHHIVGPPFPPPYLWKRANNRKSGLGSANLWSFPLFSGRESCLLSPSSLSFSMSGTSLPQILKRDFSIGFLHEGGRVWNCATVLGSLCRASKKIYLPFTLSWPTMFQLTLPSFLHLHSSWFCKMFYTVHQKGRILPS